MASKSKNTTPYSPTDLGHWTALCDLPITIENQEGFIYRITELHTNRPYYGKKTFWTRKKGKRFCESDWKTYSGSSNELGVEMALKPTSNYKHDILMICPSKSFMNYAEVAIQVYGGALIANTFNYMLGGMHTGKIPQRFKKQLWEELQGVQSKLDLNFDNLDPLP